MHFQSSVLAIVAFATTVHSHAAILAAVGDSGASQGFLVDPDIARNCTNISPCQQDATIIRDNEITQNIVNACGRTEINGNIDIGEQTEAELAAGRMTTVSSGSVMQVTIHQVNADGAGPFECDMDETSNAQTTLTPLKVTNNIPGSLGLSQAKEQDFTINVQMPDNFNCIGASTGNICTVRCRNNAVAGPFGGCFAVQQTDGTGRPDDSAAAVETTQTLEGIEAQILQNKKDFPAAVIANQNAGKAEQGAAAISALITATVNPNAAATQTAAAGNGNANGNANQNAGGKGKGRGKGNAGNNNANGNAANNQQAAAGNGANNQQAGNAANDQQAAAGNNNGAGNAANNQQAAAGNNNGAGNAANNQQAAAGKGANNAQNGNANAGQGANAGNAADNEQAATGAGNANGNAGGRGRGNQKLRRRSMRSRFLNREQPTYVF
ncbi:hypothetical protein FB567DRAFT_483384 [Paraphoma chrysanthemicola]|uniref:GEgh 16 protein n=1 Tax=Paraphoma chrysanthemicola TaxID=798071 RepID=A0A8K0VS47_9PLEO|nr:hypothetical protein FB567DRAFT_483384 [Paraphoma chrysanthemicola]